MSDRSLETPNQQNTLGHVLRNYRKVRPVVKELVAHASQNAALTRDELKLYRKGVYLGAVQQDKLSREEIKQLEEELLTAKIALEKEKYLDTMFGELGFLNKVGLEEASNRVVETMKKHEISGIVVSIDADRLKEINDTYGHAAGDQLLTFIAEALHDNTRSKSDFIVHETKEEDKQKHDEGENNVIAHTGGDEFWAILPGMTMDHTDKWKTKFLDKLGEKVIGGIPVSASIGFAVIDVNDFNYSKQQADEAMYADKQSRGVQRST